MALKRFMVVDHNSDTTMQLKSLLGEMRMQDVTLSTNSEEALGLIGPKRIEFIVVNWELKPISGLAFIQRVRANAASAHMPFLIYSARLKGEEVRLLEDMGISNVVPFPLDRNKVIDAVKSITSREDALDPTVRELRTVTAMVGAGQLKEAMERLLPTTATAKAKDLAYTLKGDIECRQQAYKESEKSLGTAIEANAKNKGAQQVLAKVYSQTGRHKEAINMLGKLCDSSPLNVSNLLSLSGAFITADRHEEAGEVLAKVSDIDRTNPTARDQKGTMAFKSGDFELAKELLQATPNGDEMCRTLNNIAIGMVSKGDFDKGISSYRAAIEIMQDKNLSHLLKYNLGLAFKKAEKWQEAMQVLGESVLENPSFEKSRTSFEHVVKLMKSKKLTVDEEFVAKVSGAKGASRAA